MLTMPAKPIHLLEATSNDRVRSEYERVYDVLMDIYIAQLEAFGDGPSFTETMDFYENELKRLEHKKGLLEEEYTFYTYASFKNWLKDYMAQSFVAFDIKMVNREIKTVKSKLSVLKLAEFQSLQEHVAMEKSLAAEMMLIGKNADDFVKEKSLTSYEKADLEEFKHKHLVEISMRKANGFLKVLEENL